MKDIFANKASQQHFLATFGHEIETTFSRSQMRRAKLKAAKFRQKILKGISNGTSKVCRREISEKQFWILPLLFKEQMVDIRALPLGFLTSLPPEVSSACDHPNCV